MARHLEQRVVAGVLAVLGADGPRDGHDGDHELLPDHDILGAQLHVRARLQLLLQVLGAVEAEDGAVLHDLPLIQRAAVRARLPRPPPVPAAVAVSALRRVQDQAWKLLGVI